MSEEYVSFSKIDPYDGTEQWTVEQIEAAEFFSKMDWEGGLDGLYEYGGAESFPPEVREYANAYGKAYEDLREVVVAWGKARGVVY